MTGHILIRFSDLHAGSILLNSNGPLLNSAGSSLFNNEPVLSDYDPSRDHNRPPLSDDRPSVDHNGTRLSDNGLSLDNDEQASFKGEPLSTSAVLALNNNEAQLVRTNSTSFDSVPASVNNGAMRANDAPMLDDVVPPLNDAGPTSRSILLPSFSGASASLRG